MTAISRAVRETTGGLPRQFWWLWTSTLVNRLGGFVVTFLALYLTVQRGYSAAYAGLVAALFGLGGAAGAVLGGVLADRVGRRATLLAAQLGAAVTTAVLGFVTDPLAIAAVATLVGLTGNASRPALSAMIADLVPAADRVRAFSLNYWAINIGFGVSAAAAGFIAAEGYLWLFLGDAFTTVLCALVVYAKAAETMPAAPADRGTHEKAETSTLLDVMRDRRFMALAGLTFLFAAVMQQASSTLAVDMGQHGLSARQFGLVAAVNGVVIVLLQMPVTRALRSRSSGVLLAAGSLVLAWGIGLTVFATSVAVYAVTVVIWTLGEIVHAPASMSVVADLAPPHARGRYQGMFTLAWSAAAFAGPLAGGLALQYLGRDSVWLGCAAIGTVAAAGYYLLLRPRTAPLQPAVPVEAGRDLPVA
ncbi:MFS transporter [Streptomyces cocklensis]|uniref:Predicted arabinose efflux permease, MFS family n=1 Tax=Actinacidiphila cocklensis TaxID=887465 RepID=A0A9W4E321_9ACTN|nr:MFS transporter [Actinacidiphila cocklensis]MDD1061617.1 MFS transporter [Actinacidiphila cocklensis]WSX77658.1 MFS transporter [Streptomyces sp. NBC_00899]CAG6392360.1 Predicted arabinose efflux permease, MFS family [Actinacidiphila cocklensis]